MSREPANHVQVEAHELVVAAIGDLQRIAHEFRLALAISTQEAERPNQMQTYSEAVLGSLTAHGGNRP